MRLLSDIDLDEISLQIILADVNVYRSWYGVLVMKRWKKSLFQDMSPSKPKLYAGV